MSFMKSRNGGAVTIVMVLVGMLVGLAPLLHAICITPGADAVGSSVSHVMADGTVMAMVVEKTAAETVTAEVMPLMAAVGSALAAAADVAQTTGLSEMVGAIILVAGLTILTVLSVRFCRSREALMVSGPGLAVRSILRVPAQARPPTDVSLHALGISRT